MPQVKIRHSNHSLEVLTSSRQHHRVPSRPPPNLRHTLSPTRWRSLTMVKALCTLSASGTSPASA